jgi:hypothetical protein
MPSRRAAYQVPNLRREQVLQSGGEFAAVIPAEYTRAEFPLEYYFEVQMSDGKVGLFPGFAPELTNQPYFVVRGS